ncbi:class I SAM-dependent methyltransferase [Sulfurovum sp.]|uniref:class I SAM-dependent methyltransferase n=1 Tax=Sulfurovum sp. TaxID=1969726 RepID=UPI0035636BA0
MTTKHEDTREWASTGVVLERIVMPVVLDACCGTRMFWFDKEDSRTLFVDKRVGTRVIDVGTPGTKGRKPKVVKPDKVVDFRNMPFGDNSFHHVVFDPPHFYKGAGKTGRIAFDYGLLDKTWRDDIKDGFAECFRVLSPMGTLIFKWCEAEIPLREVLELTPNKPLYGHRSGKKAQTHWVAFIKA